MTYPCHFHQLTCQHQPPLLKPPLPHSKNISSHQPNLCLLCSQLTPNSSQSRTSSNPSIGPKTLLYVWPSFPQGFRWRKLQAGILDLGPQITSVKNLCILSTGICILRPPGPGEQWKKSPCSCNSHCLFSWASSGDMLLVYGIYSVGYIPSGSELLLQPFPFIRAIRAVQIFVLEFSKGWLGIPGGQICRWCFCQPTSDTARRCRSLQWPGVSGGELWPV